MIEWKKPDWQPDKVSWLHCASMKMGGKTYNRFNLAESEKITDRLRADASRHFYGVVSTLTMRLA